MISFNRYFTESNNIVRLCANCEKEFGKIPREPNKMYSHGICRRHSLEMYKMYADLGIPAAKVEYERILKDPDQSKFSPDMAENLKESAAAAYEDEYKKAEAIERIKYVCGLGSASHITQIANNEFRIKTGKVITYIKQIGQDKGDWVFHRLDGPSLINHTSPISEPPFLIDGKNYTESEYWQRPEVKAYAAGGQQAVNILDI